MYSLMIKYDILVNTIFNTRQIIEKYVGKNDVDTFIERYRSEYIKKHTLLSISFDGNKNIYFKIYLRSVKQNRYQILVKLLGFLVVLCKHSNQRVKI